METFVARNDGPTGDDIKSPRNYEDVLPSEISYGEQAYNFSPNTNLLDTILLPSLSPSSDGLSGLNWGQINFDNIPLLFPEILPITVTPTVVAPSPTSVLEQQIYGPSIKIALPPTSTVPNLATAPIVTQPNSPIVVKTTTTTPAFTFPTPPKPAPKKINWLPIAIITGVLGVAFFYPKSKNKEYVKVN